MALVIPGKTPCLLCGRTIKEGDDIVAFPAFLRAEHRLGMFSDGIFHETCFRASPEGAEAAELFAVYRAIQDGRPQGISLDEYEEWAKTAYEPFRERVRQADHPKTPASGG
ncbi:hypothetical protein EON81_23240 [bacterium]|nr:MAG: hypothetical protein EON81_23240 [bacterium]